MFEPALQPEPESPLTDEAHRLRQIESNKPLVALLDAWLEEPVEDPEAERRQFLEFMRGIDEHRTERKLFTELIERYEQPTK
jgi:hypothetical protein